MALAPVDDKRDIRGCYHAYLITRPPRSPKPSEIRRCLKRYLYRTLNALHATVDTIKSAA